MTLFIIAGTYLGVGAVALCLFDHWTKRIRSKLVGKSVEAQSMIASSDILLPGSISTGGTYVGSKTALVILIAATWLFWPAVFIGALTDKKEDKQ